MTIVIGGAGTVLPGERLRICVDGAEFVLWRTASGALRLMDNRCPHRGTRLSIGFVRGERLLCAYHGWAFDGDGACAHIPAHPDAPPAETIRVRSHEVSEAYGLVFLGEAPDLPLEAPLSFCRSVFIDRPASDLPALLQRRLDATALRPGVWRFGDALIGTHAPDGRTTALHAACPDDADSRLRLARRLTAFRDKVNA